MKLLGPRAGHSSVLLRRATNLLPGEGPRVGFAALWFCALMTANYSLRPLRDAMGVAGGVRELHWLFTATFLVMLGVVPLFGYAVARFDRQRLVRVIHRFFAANLLVFFASMQGWFGDAPSLQLWTARVFFVWTSVFNLLVISLFWSVMSDLFSRADARRLFGLIATGGSIGAIAGPSLGGALALSVSPAVLPLVGALLLELACWAMRGACSPQQEASEGATQADDRSGDTDSGIEGGILSAIPDLLRSPMLLGVCAYILLMTMSSTILYFVQAQIVAAAFTDDASRTAVFAALDLGVNTLTLIAQSLLTARVIRHLGLTTALASVPLLCILGFATLALAPVLAVLLAVQLLRRTCNYALARPAREVLYTHVDRSQRYRAKNLIDTVVYRGGDALTGWMFAGLTALGLGLASIASIAAGIAGAWVLVAAWLGRRGTPATDANETSSASAIVPR